MKKIIFLIVFFLFAKTGFSQVTITGNDMPKSGEIWVIYADDSVIAYPLTAPSNQAQIWSYGDGIAPDTADGVFFQDASSLPGASVFAGSNLADNESPDITFFTSNSTGLYNNGEYYTDDPSNPDIWNPGELIIPAPFSYGDSLQSVSNSVSITYDSTFKLFYKDISHEKDDFVADAFGRITTFFVSGVQVLRVKDNMYETDSVFTSPTLNGVYTNTDAFVNNDRSYLFLKNGSVSPVMEIDVDPVSGDNEGAEYINAGSISGIKPITKNDFFTNVYPNPASSSAITFSIEGAKQEWLKIYNVLGECVETENVENVNSLTLSANILSKGIYYYCLLDKDGKVQEGKKFIVQ